MTVLAEIWAPRITEEHFCINRTRSRYVRWVTCVGWRCEYEIVRVPTLRRVMWYKCIVTGERAICEETVYEDRVAGSGGGSPTTLSPGSQCSSFPVSPFSSTPLISFVYQSIVPRITARMMKPAVPRDRDINPDRKISETRRDETRRGVT